MDRSFESAAAVSADHEADGACPICDATGSVHTTITAGGHCFVHQSFCKPCRGRRLVDLAK